MARAIGWSIGAFLGVHWAESLLYEPRLRINPSDLVLAAALVLAAPTLWRQRHLLIAPIPLLAAAAALGLLISTLAAGDPLSPDLVGRLGVQVSLVGLACALFGAPALTADRRLFARAAVAIALALSAIALVGGALGASGVLDGLEPRLWRPAFVDRTGHPTLAGLPRLTGGLSVSAEGCGLWAVAAAAVLAGAAVHRPRAAGWIALPAATALGTLSIAGAGIAIVAVWWWAATRPGSRAALPLAVVAVVGLLALQLPVHRGPVTLDEPASARICAEGWPNHWAQWRGPDDTCAVRTGDGGHAVTRYALAKRHALALWTAHPLLGVGAAGFARHAAAETSPDGARSWNPYYTSHGTWHGVAAEQGLVGLLLWIALAVAATVAVRRGFAVDRAAAIALAALLTAFAAASLDLDVHGQRLLWLALGAAAGLARREPA